MRDEVLLTDLSGLCLSQTCAQECAGARIQKSHLHGKLWRCRPARVAQVGCKPSFCSLTCLSKHGMCCPLQGKFLPKFCEGFSGPGAPATWAVAQKGVCVETPLDRDSPLDRCDFFHLKKFSAGTSTNLVSLRPLLPLASAAPVLVIHCRRPAVVARQLPSGGGQ